MTVTMKLDTQLTTTDPRAIPSAASEIEHRRYDGAWTSETAHDPFLPLAVASYHTTRLTLGTAVTIAFSRNPMTVAYVANDLQRYCGGRFRLGLGSQVSAHVRRRFSMPWSEPARRMREFVAAVSEIWRCWETGDRLRFRGEFYQHTLMTPFFTPQPHEFGRPAVLLAAIGPAMTRVAGDVADGILLHSVESAQYVRARVLPCLHAALRARGRPPETFEVAARAMVASGRNSDELATAVAGVRARIAFYASTPAYRPILEYHGMEGLADELHRLSRTDDDRRWQTMADLVPDELFDALTVTGSAREVADGLVDRYAGCAGRLRMYTPYGHGATVERDVMARLR